MRRSPELLKLCAEHSLEVHVADNMQLPYRSGVCDAAISIAVSPIHCSGGIPDGDHVFCLGGGVTGVRALASRDRGWRSRHECTNASIIWDCRPPWVPFSIVVADADISDAMLSSPGDTSHVKQGKTDRGDKGAASDSENRRKGLGVCVGDGAGRKAQRIRVSA